MLNQSIRRIPVLLVFALFAALFASPASAADSHIVPDRYIVVLEDSVKGPATVARNQTEQRDGKLGFIYRHAFKGYSAELSKGAVQALRHDPRVASVEPDVRGGVAAQNMPTGIERIFATENGAIDIDEKDDVRIDVDVAVIDSGIDHEHPDLNVVGRTNCSNGTEKEASCANGVGTDENGHGTHVAGTIGAIDNGYGVVGVAPGARLWAVKVLDVVGGGYLSELIAGINWITATRLDEDPENDIEVANSSLRYWNHTSSVAFEKAISASLDAGVVHVIAAGNEAENVQYIPGNYPDVITVSALADLDGSNGEGNDPLASFSNFGPLIDIAAPGADILSTIPWSWGSGYGDMSGTSMASPHVAGAAALLAAESQPNSQEDVETIRETLEEEGWAAEEAGASNWIDTSEDGVQEPLLYLGGKRSAPGLVATFGFSYGNEGSGDGELANPTGISVDGEGNLWVADTANDRVQKFSPEGKYLTHFGEAGAANGQLDEPADIAIDPEGNLWVLEAGNFRVQKFSPEGKYLGHFGGQGSGEGQFSYPTAIAADPEGNLWVADHYNDRVQKFSPEGKYLLEVGGEGPGSGQFAGPYGIAIDSEGDLWVVDAGNNRIQQFDSEGKYLTQFGEAGEGAGEFSAPAAIDIDPKGDVWVTETLNNSIGVQKFNPEGEYLGRFGAYGGGEGELAYPLGIATSSDGNVWVSDLANHRVQEWVSPGSPLAITGTASELKTTEATLNAAINPKGVVTTYRFEYGTTTAYGSKAPASPKSVGAGAQLVEASEKLSGLTEGTTYHYRVVAKNEYGIVQGEDQTFTTLSLPIATTEAASGVGTTQATLNGTVNPKGSVTAYHFEYGATTSYGTKVPIPAKSVGSGTEALKVTEKLSGLEAGATYHYRVVVTNEGGAVNGEDRTFATPQIEAPSFAFGFQGSGEAALDSPQGATFDLEGDVWVADTGNDRIQEFSPEGELIASHGSAGSGLGQFEEPTAVTYQQDMIWVADTGNDRIQMIEAASGEALATIGSSGSGDGQLSEPRGVAVDSDGVWVADTGNDRIQRFNVWGEYLGQLGEEGSGNGQFSEPHGVAIGPDENVWVADTGNDRVQKFSPEGKYLLQGASEGEAPLSEPTGIAADGQSNVWVADSAGNRVVGIDREGAYRTHFGAKGSGEGQFSAPRGVAVDSEGDVWVADTGNDRIQKWLLPPLPTLDASGLLSTGATEAKLHATINPNGSQTTYRFEYGTTTSYGSKAPASPKSIGSGTSPVEVTETLSGLSPTTTYHFRLVASSEKGTVVGHDQTFTTTKPGPIATTETATSVLLTEATLNASVNPSGEATTYQFEYGTTTSYGAKAPISPKEVGSGSTAVKVAEKLSGLKEGTTYHFRITATNAKGTAQGIDRTFTTGPPPPQAKTSSAVDVQMSTVTLRGEVDPEGAATTYQFEYGTSTAYGSVVPASPKSAGSGTSWAQASEPLSGLKAGTTYFFRIVATNNGGKVTGGAGSFKTFSAEAPAFDFAFGSYGSGNGQFEFPQGIAIDKGGNVWVSDAWTNRLQKFSPEGKYLTQFGSEGSGNGQLKSPAGIAIDKAGNLWVADTGNDRIQKFSSEGKYLAQFGGAGSGNGQLNQPAGIAIDALGNIWVADTYNDRVQKFSPEGKYLAQFGASGAGAGELSGPTGIAIDSGGDIWVLDTYNYRVQEFSSSGKYLSELGELGSEGEGQLGGPAGIAFAGGNLWVTDATGRVEAFSPEGQHLAFFGLKAGSEESMFAMPFGIAADAEGNLWVTDAGYGEVQKWGF